jgi:hypothetical protein
LHLSKKLFAIGTRPEQNPLDRRIDRGTQPNGYFGAEV